MNIKGFNVTELILSFTIIGIVLIIVFPSFCIIVNHAKNENYKNTVVLIEDITKLYVLSLDKNVDKPEEITIKELIDKGILDEDLKDPRTNKNISLQSKVVISKQKDGD